jgi:transcriptional regulator with GAF, ATPase, and Fis domain
METQQLLPAKADFFGLVGESPPMRQIKAVIKQVAPTDMTVLISGESGTGKELAANAIHQLSNRARFPMITVNCGAIPEGIFESEIFGHVRGAFTSADRTRKGYFEMADGGTVFLDEIGEMPLGAQAKILRIIEMGEFMKVGSAQSQNVNVRVIAATNRDLSEAVALGQFRQDLYFRLKAVNILLPPLRERREDIPPLVDLFLDDVCRRNNIHRPQISEGAMNLLQNSFWEGNVRELRHFLESLVILERGNALDEIVVGRHLRTGSRPLAHLPVHVPRGSAALDRDFIVTMLLELKRELSDVKALLARAAFPTAGPVQSHPLFADSEITADDTAPSPTLVEMEKDQIERILREVHGNRRQAAETLGISERTLYRKIKEYGL